MGCCKGKVESKLSDFIARKISFNVVELLLFRPNFLHTSPNHHQTSHRQDSWLTGRLTCVVAGGALSRCFGRSLCLCLRLCLRLCLGFSLQVRLQLDHRDGRVLRQRRGSRALCVLGAQSGATGQDQSTEQGAQQHPEVGACAKSGGSHFQRHGVR